MRTRGRPPVGAGPAACPGPGYGYGYGCQLPPVAPKRSVLTRPGG